MGAPFAWFDLTVADGAKIAGFYQGLKGPAVTAARGPEQLGWRGSGSGHGAHPAHSSARTSQKPMSSPPLRDQTGLSGPPGPAGQPRCHWRMRRRV